MTIVVPGRSVRSDSALEAPEVAQLQVELAAARSKIANLDTALQSCRMIGTAIGILVERYKMSPEESFRTLVAVSQHVHRKLRDIASDLVFTGELPD
jgi:AmiR/NasT family two-component response regulator